MAKNSEPIAKRCKALGISPAVMGYTNKDTFRNSYTKNRRKKSEYAMQLQEKQKVKFIYGILEKQFHSYYEKAAKAPGQTGAVLLTMVETRLDNVAFRTGFCKTRREVDAEKLTAKVVALPTREDIDYPVEEHLIVEFYSR